jgi:hypothetical protein
VGFWLVPEASSQDGGIDVLGIETAVLRVEKNFVIRPIENLILHILNDIGGYLAVHTSPISILSNQW